MTTQLHSGASATLLLLSQLFVSAWSPTGQMVVDQIANERLTVDAQARCSEVIAVKVPPENVKLGKSMVAEGPRTGSFLTVGCAADDVRSDADREVHDIDLAFSADGTTPQLAPASKNIGDAGGLRGGAQEPARPRPTGR